jgi:3-methyladenine DNA glycosylase Tag
LIEIAAATNNILEQVSNVRHLSVEFETEKVAKTSENIVAKITADRTFKRHFSSLNRIRENSDNSQSVNYAASRFSSVPLPGRKDRGEWATKTLALKR